MKYTMFSTEVQKSKMNEAFKNFKGGFGSLRPEWFNQSLAGLPKIRNEASPMKNSAQIGLRIMTNFYDNNILCGEFITLSHCMLDYEEPANEEQIFQEVTEKAMESHKNILSSELKKMGFSHSAFQEYNQEEITKAYRNLIDFFRAQF